MVLESLKIEYGSTFDPFNPLPLKTVNSRPLPSGRNLGHWRKFAGCRSTSTVLTGDHRREIKYVARRMSSSRLGAQVSSGFFNRSLRCRWILSKLSEAIT